MARDGSRWQPPVLKTTTSGVSLTTPPAPPPTVAPELVGVTRAQQPGTRSPRKRPATPADGSVPKAGAKPRTYGPDGSVLPALHRVMKQDRVRWVVMKFQEAPAEVSPGGVPWQSPGKCFTVEEFGAKEKDGIADWSRFLASLPRDECRLGLFSFDFRAVRQLVMVLWSPPVDVTSWEDQKIWDIRKEALSQGVARERVEAAELGDTPRESLVALLLELTPLEKLRRICGLGLSTLSSFIGKQPKVSIERTCTMRLPSDVVGCVQEAKDLIAHEHEAAAAEVARTEVVLAARKARQLAEAYAIGFYYRRTKHEREVRVSEAAAAAKKEQEEAIAAVESEKRRIADEARKRREYGAKAERDPVWAERLSAAKKGLDGELTRWHHEHSLVAPSDPDVYHKGVRRARVQESSALVRGEVSSDMIEASLKSTQSLLAKATAARAAIYNPPSGEPDWSAHREVKFTERGSLGLRLEEDQCGIVTVSALLSTSRWEHVTETMQYDDGLAKTCGQIRVGDRVVAVAAGEPGVTPDSQIVEFSGHKVRLTVILGVLARNIRPIKFTFGPPLFGTWPGEEEGGARPVVPVKWGEPPEPLPLRPGEAVALREAQRPLGAAVSTEFSAIEPGDDNVNGEADDDLNDVSMSDDRGMSMSDDRGIRKGQATIGIGSSMRPAIGIRIPMRTVN